MKKHIVRPMLIGIAFVLLPLVLIFWMSPLVVWKDLIEHIKSGEPFGPFDALEP